MQRAVGNINGGDRRDKVRRRVYLGADIIIDSGLPSADCVVKNLSQAGANIFVGQQKMIPPCFALQVHKTGARHSATIVWRRGQEIGVCFSC
jgi:hypothetical protein